MPSFRREPAVYVSLAAALIGLAVAFGLDLTDDQTAAIIAVATIVSGLVIRQNVTPVHDA